MRKYDVVEAWLNNVAYSHSNSPHTRYYYKQRLMKFCNFIDVSPTEILEDYEATTDRQFKKKYAQYVRAYIGELTQNGYTSSTIKSKVTAVKSFFKYNDLPLGFVPIAKPKVTFHNRDITKEEVKTILEMSRPRNRAFFCMMSQTGLRPQTLCKLRKKHIEPDFNEGKIPCKVQITEELTKGKFSAYFTFMGEESVRYLKAYLATRPNVTPESYLFTKHGSETPANPKSFSNLFVRTIQQLKQKGFMTFEQKEKGKPRDVRLYNLRKFFRKYAGQAGIEYVNFWMGHTANYKASHIPASDIHYFSREDVEFQKQLYKEKAMPFLRLETATPTETEKTIAELRRQLNYRNKEINAMKETMVKIQPLVEFVNSFDAPENLKTILKFFKDDLTGQYSDEKLRPDRIKISPWVSNKLDEIAKRKDITPKEALEQLVKEDLEILEKSDREFKRMDKRAKRHAKRHVRK